MYNRSLHFKLIPLVALIFSCTISSCKKDPSVHQANAVVKLGCLMIFKIDDNTEYTPENQIDSAFTKDNLLVAITYRFTGNKYRSATCDYSVLDDSQLRTAMEVISIKKR